MTIDTKFNVNEKVFMLRGKEILEGHVQSILVSATPRGSNVTGVYKKTVYAIQTKDKRHRGVKQSILFKTKKLATQELIKKIGYEVSVNDLRESE